MPASARSATGTGARAQYPYGLGGPVGGGVVPGGLDQQAPGVGVAGLRDEALGPAGAREVLGGEAEVEVGGDGGALEAAPVADLDGQ